MDILVWVIPILWTDLVDSAHTTHTLHYLVNSWIPGILDFMMTLKVILTVNQGTTWWDGHCNKLVSACCSTAASSCLLVLTYMDPK